MQREISIDSGMMRFRRGDVVALRTFLTWMSHRCSSGPLTDHKFNRAVMGRDALTTYREPGDQIQVVFLIGSDPSLIIPVTVVEDSEDRIAHYLCPGTRYLRRTLLDGSPVPRVVPLDELHRRGSKLVEGEWRGSRQLILTQPGCAHSIRLRWDEVTNDFRGWYVNLQEPVRRTERGFESHDQFLDILVAPDRSWQWKDEDELEEAVAVGRVSQGEADAIRREGERIVLDIEKGRFPFDGSLLAWSPDPSWGMPVLPDDWNQAFGSATI